jgi:urate oxidase
MANLGHNCYGKSRVRLSRISRHGDRHEFNEWTVDVLVEGEFTTSFTQADNSTLLPTDTMKNTVYSRARVSDAATIEQFAMELGDYLLEENAHFSGVKIEIEQKAWERMAVDGKPDPTTFRLGGPEVHTVRAVRDQGRQWTIRSGVDGLVILKTTNSAFTGYIQDRLTTLKPVTDRIFGTRASATWEYALSSPPYAEVRSRMIGAMLREFTTHHSMSVQHTLFAMGKAALEAAPEVASVTLTMPNLHHLLADLSPFGQDNPNHIFIPIDEPHGYIEATIER